MADHLDKNGFWVMLVFAIVLTALLAAAIYTAARTHSRKKRLQKNEDTPD